MNDFLAPIFQIRWQDILDIALVSYLIYKTLMLLKGTRAMQTLFGLLLLLLTLVGATVFQLYTTQWLIRSFLSSLVLVVIILFQAEIRRGLSRMGRGPFFTSERNPGHALEEVIRAAGELASRKLGGLMVLERQIGLGEILDTGTSLKAQVNQDLLVAIFQPPGPLHDGAVIIGDGGIKAARCLLPLSGRPGISGHLGTRHRAAVGISEDTDAVAVVVSEERGELSLAVGGELHLNLDTATMRKLLYKFMGLNPAPTPPGEAKGRDA